MQMSFQIVEQNGAMPAVQNLRATCCNDSFSSFSSMCGFVIPHSSCAAYREGINQVAFSTFSTQIGSREIVTPTHKIYSTTTIVSR